MTSWEASWEEINEILQRYYNRVLDGATIYKILKDLEFIGAIKNKKASK